MGPGITIGDVITVIALLFGTLFSIWALIVGFALLFPNKAERARIEAQSRPWRSIGIGFFYTLGLGIFAAVMTGNPNPLVKLIGFAIYSLLIGTMVVGGSGVALIAAHRMQGLERRRGGYRNLERGALLLVVGTVLPIFGWFLFAPLLMYVSAGAGARALFVRRAGLPVSLPEPAAPTPVSQGASQEFMV